MGTHDEETLAKIDSLLACAIGLDPEDKPGLVRFLEEVEKLADGIIRDDENGKKAQAAQAAQRSVEELIFAVSGQETQLLEAVGTRLDHLRRLLAGEETAGPESGAATSSGWLSLQSLVDPAMLKEFAVGGDGTMDELEASLLVLEKGDDRRELKKVRCIVHTLKGEAGVLGFHELEVLCHEVENYMDKRQDSIAWQFFFHLVDHLRAFFAAVLDGQTYSFDAPLAELMLLKKAPPVAEPAADEEPLPELKARPGLTARLKQDEFLVREFVTNALEHLENADQMLLRLEKNTGDGKALDSLFRSFHTVKGMASFLELDDITVLAHEVENLFEQAREARIETSGYTVDLLFLCNDNLKGMIRDFQASIEADEDPQIHTEVLGLVRSLRKAYRLAAAGGETVERSPEAAPAPVSVDETPGKEVSPPSPPASPTPPRPAADAGDGEVRGPTTRLVDVVKIDAITLDRLIDFIGELVIVESMIARDPEIAALASQRIHRNMAQFAKITRELQEISLAMRTMPLNSTFQKMARLVRDLSRKQQKKIDFILSGEDTELDRLLVEKIGDPLIHMIRNAVDHGIEASSEERVRAGKAPVARVKLAAFHKGGNIVIELSDDGRGINREKVLAKARSQGLIAADAQPTEREILQLIFHAGFSTAAQVSDVSGRGVGMDVVKRNIEALRGRIEIESEEGRGTRFSLVLPLTLAIIDGMTITVGGERYVIPILSVVESVNAGDLRIENVADRGKIVRLREKILPYCRLRDLFRVEAESGDSAGIVIVVQDMGQEVALHVDELLGQQQIVIKSLGDFLQKVPGISGGAIMPDGSVGLIVDVPAVVRKVRGR